ncbi:HAD-IA family hydrolase [Streptomyces sp. NPDC058291]|uniref:HAD-IA family hydrolase n=1 Tax=Streptomyces sp. NPDC058291 TaxID=3346427 RepID=UPI0036EEB7D3
MTSRTVPAQALLIDNDGTLVSTPASVGRGWTRWAREYGITAEDLARTELHGRPRRAGGRRSAAEQVDAAVRDAVHLQPSDAGDGLGDPLPRTARPALGDAHRGTADDVDRAEPDPQSCLLAARRLGVDPGRCAVFADPPAGLAAGRPVGMTTVALATTHQPHELDADLVVPDPRPVGAGHRRGRGDLRPTLTRVRTPSRRVQHADTPVPVRTVLLLY